MKYDKTTIFGVGACILLLLLWSPLMHYLGVTPAPRPTAPPAEGPETVHAPDPAPAETAPPTAPTAPPEFRAPAASADSSPAATHIRAPGVPFGKPNQTVSLTADGVFTALVEPNGGGVVEVQLHKYLMDDRKREVRLGHYGHPLAALVLDATGWKPGPATVTEQTDTHLRIERQVAEPGVTIVEDWRIGDGGPYRIDYSVALRNHGTQSVPLRNLAVSCGALLPTCEGGAASGAAGVGLAGGVDYLAAGETHPKAYAAKAISKLKPAAAEKLAGTPLQWVTVHSQYFMFYVTQGASPLSGGVMGLMPDPEQIGVKGAPEWYYSQALLAAPDLAPGQEKEWTFTCYAGPKEYEILRGLGPRVETVLHMDFVMFWRPAWMGAISGWILRFMLTLNNRFDHPWGYGFAIILLTFLVKMLFWPLTHSSTVSMRKMQKVQPKIQELREKYKGDPQKMNRKVMELYKDEKVNPLGGCLPILLQIPVFFALFNTFRSAIELRQASFIWVLDLSMPDDVAMVLGFPIRPLAILMGATMIIQQKMMPSSPDPTQARMMMFMSFFFIFLFYSMPSGLTLYWTVNQVLTIVQNFITLRWETQKTSAAPVSPRPAP
ncbi:MAG: hypothetical protein A3K19_12835 [Lentisphaerae bacterium RIFOXYB12_FULL_65_16]|nr:MAG: hypothetical protein A3K18_13570 [Lentisphaerae bacterium RIFOXYA12_64_32]OGV87198.1 MAG: hypothetical protein A3K19_12835 [Lentisphaerae bacterium RIFOXYB12_FULL_65_16]